MGDIPADGGMPLIERVNRAIQRRAYTEKPGGDWTTVDPGIDSLAPVPTYYGTSGRARIYATGDEDAFEVYVFSHTGHKVWCKAYASMDAAFRNGRKVANQSEDG